MKLIRYQHSPLYSPGSNFTNLRDEMDRLFDVAFPAFSALQRGGFEGGLSDQFPIDMYQNKDSYVVRAELPGFRKEDLSVEVSDGILTVSAHQKTEAKGASDKNNGDGAVSQERRVSRAISLPELMDVEKIQAGYENGVLTVTLPKREEAKPRQITVDVK